MKKVDIIIALIYIAAMVILYFFWGCRLDMIVTVVGAVIAVLAGVTAHMQYKKISELEKENKEE